MTWKQALTCVRKRLWRWCNAAIDVADQSIVKGAVIVHGSPQRAEPAADGAHNLTNMFSDNHVANPDFTELTVHVIDKNLGQPSHIKGVGLAVFKPQKHERQYGRDHVEPAIKAVWHLALNIPMRLPCLGNNLVI